MLDSDQDPEQPSPAPREVRPRGPRRALSPDDIRAFAARILKRSDPAAATARAFKDHPDFEQHVVVEHDPEQLQP